MDIENLIQDTEEYRDSIATVDAKGKRVWIYPKKPAGRFYNARNIATIVYLIFFFSMPFVRYDGEPLLLFNVLERKFIIFGLLFTPQDFHLVALSMLAFFVFIILFTVVFGRLFCGWVCPQTVFMEMVFRKIEYWIEGDWTAQRKLNEGPWTREKVIKKTAKAVIFFIIAVLVSNTFLAYMIGSDRVIRIITEPMSAHMSGFAGMLIFSGVFYFVFTYMREQVCIAVCPYGRLQGVLLGKDSIVVAYDHVRGEPRTKLRKHPKKEAETANPVETIQAAVAKQGDCIDCKLCIHVCPTGIDIRNGTQLECVNCTACIDVCDAVMDKVGRPRGLIRYDSFNGIREGRKRLITPRVVAYSCVLTVLLALDVFLITARTDVEAVILRSPGSLYQKTDDSHVTNLYTYQISNKTNNDLPLTLKLKDNNGTIRLIGNQDIVAKKGGMAEGAMFIEMENSRLEGRKTHLVVEVYSGDKLVDKVKTNFMGPGK